MNWLQKVPKISSILLIAIYGVFGWIYGSWTIELATDVRLWYGLVRLSIASAISYGLGLCLILIIIIFFTAPVAIFTLGMSGWFKLDFQALGAIAASIIIFALIVEYPIAFTHFLVLSAAAMLLRLDLQTMGYSHNIVQLILIILSAISFTVGMLLFYRAI
jgi:hypothetical protein